MPSSAFSILCSFKDYRFYPGFILSFSPTFVLSFSLTFPLFNLNWLANAASDIYEFLGIIEDFKFFWSFYKSFFCWSLTFEVRISSSSRMLGLSPPYSNLITYELLLTVSICCFSVCFNFCFSSSFFYSKGYYILLILLSAWIYLSSDFIKLCFYI